MMGSKEEDVPIEPIEKPVFLEDMNEAELATALDLPSGLLNLGNTCYLNATVQCLKTVPELREVLKIFSGGWTTGASLSITAQSITASLRDLYENMDKGTVKAPLLLLQMLHLAFPRFAEKTEQGVFQQQDANECWTELIRMLQQKLPAKVMKFMIYIKYNYIQQYTTLSYLIIYLSVIIYKFSLLHCILTEQSGCITR